MKNKFAIFLIFTSLMGILSITSCKKSDEDINLQLTQASIIENNLKAVVDSVIANTHVPGIVAAVWAPNEGVNFVYTAGVANIETKKSLSPDMVFRIGSNTKTFVITVLLQLVDEGLLTLDDKLSVFFPEFPRADEVTIEMLTNMRSGIHSYTGTDEYWYILQTDPTHTWTAEEMISISALYPYDFDPGTNFTYSNINTVFGGRIIEMLTGSSLEYNVRTRIIDQLNLINTVYLVGGSQVPGYHSNGYYIGEYDPSLPASLEYFDVSWAGAAGCMVSTIYELKPYVRALVDGTFLSPELQQKRMICQEWNPPIFAKYGMGIMEYKEFYGHGGSIFGCTSVMMHSIEKNCTIVIWFNCQIETITPTLMLPVWVRTIYPDL
ncbi:MAG: beta-lactamase family protein [Bacteroidales bacterium]|nr:beta-lactamase family protein [Bacteroidales bacterium]